MNKAESGKPSLLHGWTLSNNKHNKPLQTNVTKGWNHTRQNAVVRSWKSVQTELCFGNLWPLTSYGRSLGCRRSKWSIQLDSSLKVLSIWVLTWSRCYFKKIVTCDLVQCSDMHCPFSNQVWPLMLRTYVQSFESVCPCVHELSDQHKDRQTDKTILQRDSIP